MSERGTVDVLAIGAHPDDVEVGVGGIVAKLTRRNRAVAILDLTEGELASRGSVEERRDEARSAAQILGVCARHNACLPDGGIANVPEQRLAVIRLLRDIRPRILIAPMHTDRHPDHDAAHYLVRDANYLAGLARIDTGQAPYRVPRVYCYRVYVDTTAPAVIVDVTATFETKLAALRAYRSQLFNPEYEGAETYVSSEAFWNAIGARAAYWGSRTGCERGEPLYCDGPLRLAGVPGLEEDIV